MRYELSASCTLELCGVMLYNIYMVFQIQKCGITKGDGIMICRTPGYARKFRCIADKCRDNCCIGWEIDIDEETGDYYSSVSGSFGKRLKDNIRDGCFVLGENERCPFLNSRDLCDIYITLGEEHLCQICRDHPRYFEWFGDIKEGGIGMSCEEAARLILSSDFSLTETEIPDEGYTDVDSELYPLLLSARSIIIDKLMNCELADAVKYVLELAEKLQDNIDCGIFNIPELTGTLPSSAPDMRGIFSFYQTLEPISPDWIPALERYSHIAGNAINVVPESDNELRRIAVYFIFRYFMKSVFDGDVLSRVKLAAVSTWMIGKLWQCRMYEKGSCSFEERCLIAKSYSKEIEYCEENIAALAEASYEMGCFASSAIAGLF